MLLVVGCGSGESAHPPSETRSAPAQSSDPWSSRHVPADAAVAKESKPLVLPSRKIRVGDILGRSKREVAKMLGKATWDENVATYTEWESESVLVMAAFEDDQLGILYFHPYGLENTQADRDAVLSWVSGKDEVWELAETGGKFVIQIWYAPAKTRRDARKKFVADISRIKEALGGRFTVTVEGELSSGIVFAGDPKCTPRDLRTLARTMAGFNDWPTGFKTLRCPESGALLKL